MLRILIFALPLLFVISCESNKNGNILDGLTDDSAGNLSNFYIQLQLLSGYDATDCGNLEIDEDQSEANTCVFDNFILNHSFFVSYKQQGTTSVTSTGIAYKKNSGLDFVFYDGSALGEIIIEHCENPILSNEISADFSEPFSISTDFSELFSCSNADGSPVPSGILEGNLVSMDQALAHSDSSFVALVEKVRGSVGRFRAGSKVIWSRKNDYGLGLYVSANHVFGIDSWSLWEEELIDITSINNGIFGSSQLPNIEGDLDLADEVVADFGLYHPAIPLGTTNQTILPEIDFYLGVIDNQKAIQGRLGILPNPIDLSIPLEMYDPDNRTISTHTWSNAVSGDTVIALGYPQDSLEFPYGAVSTGQIYTDMEAEEIIKSLQQHSDEEGDIAYDPEVEFFLNAIAASGMSGGGVFNSEGQLLGIMVRATDSLEAPLVRVVRMSYITEKLNQFYDALPGSDKASLKRFLGSEVD